MSDRVSRWNLGVLGLFVLGSLALRLPAIAPEPTCPPMTREFLFARAIYFGWSGDAIPAGRREVSAAQVARMTHPAPAVAETIAAAVYMAAGRETPRTARALSAIYWTVAGVLFFFAARRWTTDTTALIGTALLLFLPWTRAQSTVFDATPLALMGACAALLALARYDELPTKRRLLWAALTTSASMFVRFMTGFFLFPAFVAMRLQQVPARKVFADRDTWLFLAVATLPTAAFFVEAIWTDPLMRARLGTDMAFGLLLGASFWRDWWHAIAATITIPVFLASMLLCLFVRRGTPRAVLAGMWIGYVLYGIAFNFHTATHPYYQALALPLVALSVTGLGPLLIDRRAHALRSLPLGVAVLLTFVGGWARPAASHAAPEVAMYRAIGDVTHHSTRTIYLSACWGDPLGYYGEIAGRPWPSVYEIDMYRPLGASGIPDISAPERLRQTSASLGGAEYFISTDPAEMARQPDLQRLLDDRGPG